jgi:hypothetical protein
MALMKNPRLKNEKRDNASALLKLVELKLSTVWITFIWVITAIAVVASIKNPQKIKKYFIRGLKFWRIKRKVSFMISPKSRGFESSIFFWGIFV